MSEQIPSTADILHEKTVDALVWLEEQCASEAISAHAAMIAKQALFMAVGGLVPREVVDDLSVKPLTSAQHDWQVAVLKDRGDYRIVRRQYGGERLEMFFVAADRVGRLSPEFIKSHGGAQPLFRRLVRAIRKANGGK